MSTMDGVAKCWVDSDTIAVKSALDCLQSASVIDTRVLISGVHSSLTRHEEIRAWLKAKHGAPRLSRRVLLDEDAEAPGDMGQKAYI